MYENGRGRIRTSCAAMAFALACLAPLGGNPALADELPSSGVEQGLQVSTDTPDFVQGQDEAKGSLSWCEWEVTKDGTLRIYPANYDEDSNADDEEKTDDDALSANAEQSEADLPWMRYKDSITAVRVIAVDGRLVRPTSASRLFAGLDHAKTISLLGLDTSRLSDLSYMFSGCEALTSVDLSYLDTASVSRFDGMFYGCESLTSADVSDLDTSSARSMKEMFSGCSKLDSLDLSSFDTRNVEAAAYMFDGCKNLERIKIGSSYEIKNAYMFPDATASNKKWWSTKDSVWYTKDEIVEDRSKIADTYTDSERKESITKTGVKRLYGADRYATMGAVVKEGFYASKWAVVVSGQNYPDALCASALAGAHTAPVILTVSNKLSPQASEQLKRLKVSSVVIVGGTSAVSQQVATDLEAMSIGVDRVSGDNREDTSVAALIAARKVDSSSDTVILVTGSSFADALSVGPWSWYSKSPIVLVGSDGLLSDAAVEAIKADTGFKQVLIVGGESAVSNGVKDQLGEGYTYIREGGSNRYVTSSLISEWSCWHGLSWEYPSVATGVNFPDALSGAAFSGSTGSPLVLADSASSNTIITLTINAASIRGAYVLGGTSAVNDTVYKAVETAIK